MHNARFSHLVTACDSDTVAAVMDAGLRHVSRRGVRAVLRVLVQARAHHPQPEHGRCQRPAHAQRAALWARQAGGAFRASCRQQCFCSQHAQAKGHVHAYLCLHAEEINRSQRGPPLPDLQYFADAMLVLRVNELEALGHSRAAHDGALATCNLIAAVADPLHAKAQQLVGKLREAASRCRCGLCMCMCMHDSNMRAHGHARCGCCHACVYAAKKRSVHDCCSSPCTSRPCWLQPPSCRWWWRPRATC